MAGNNIRTYSRDSDLVRERREEIARAAATLFVKKGYLKRGGLLGLSSQAFFFRHLFYVDADDARSGEAYFRNLPVTAFRLVLFE